MGVPGRNAAGVIARDRRREGYVVQRVRTFLFEE
jgi:hypothetical protein